jgi:hypothetical protein
MRRRPAPSAGANGDLALAGGAAGKQQVGDVDARDQENEERRTEQHDQRLPKGRAHDVGGQRVQLPVGAGPAGLLTGNLCPHGRQLRLGLLDGHAGLQPRERLVLVVVAAEHVGVRLAAGTAGLEELAVAGPRGIGARDADDGVGYSTDFDPLADHTGIAAVTGASRGHARGPRPAAPSAGSRPR